MMIVRRKRVVRMIRRRRIRIRKNIRRGAEVRRKDIEREILRRRIVIRFNKRRKLRLKLKIVR